MRDVYIVGVGMTCFGRHLDRSHSDLAQEAVRLALADADIEAKALDTTVYANVVQGFFAGEMSIPSEYALRPLGISGVRTFAVEAACASSTVGMHQAIHHIRSGLSDVALVVGVEKLFSDDRTKKFTVFQQQLDLEVAQGYLKRTEGKLVPIPQGLDGPSPNILMEAYAAQARLHMATYGTTQRQIAAIASKNHNHSVHNPLSQYRKAMSIEEVLDAPLVSWPLTNPMCAPISDGASAVIVCSSEKLRQLGNKGRAIRVLAADSLTGSDREPDDYAQHVTKRLALRLYEAIGLGPGDFDLAEVHDASSSGEILQIEALGLVGPGQAGSAAEVGALSLGGRLPVNVSGGLVSKGHPLGATGTGQIHELVTQLRGEAGARQVANARLGIAENSGGFYGVEDAMSAITILEKA